MEPGKSDRDDNLKLFSAVGLQSVEVQNSFQYGFGEAQSA